MKSAGKLAAPFPKYIFKRHRKRLIQAYRKERLSQHFLIILYFFKKVRDERLFNGIFTKKKLTYLTCTSEDVGLQLNEVFSLNVLKSLR